MNYSNKIVAITGANGFLGSLLAKKLKELGAQVVPLYGDTRDPKTFAQLDHNFDYLFHFAAPSSQVLFKQKPQYCIDTTINGFLNAVNVCKTFGIKLIYPSTGLLSQGRFNEYAMCKKICEDIHLGENVDAIGMRIFATYGPSEGHKRDFASVPYIFARDMKAGKSPEIFGDGEQVRDFIYEDDCIDAIVQLAEESNEKIVDIGSGVGIDFITIVNLINKHLKKKVEPTFVDKPDNYVDKTVCDSVWQKTSFETGIKKVLESL